MKALVTGANGQLGRDLCPLLEAAGHTVLRTDSGQREGVETLAWLPLDITDTDAVLRCVEETAPDIILHGAAFTDVDGCERDPNKAFRVNELGTWNLASAASTADIPLVYISTDFVFDGKKTTPYTEEDTPNPLNHYGASKLAGERKVAALCRKHFIVRTAWLFGAQGPNFPRKILELAKTRSELPVVVDQVGSPTHTLDLARTLLSLLDSPLYGIYHVTNKGACSWFDLAKKTLEIAGVKGVEVKPIPASFWQSPTTRPSYSALRHLSLELQGRDDLPRWEEALEQFLQILPR